MNIGEGNGNPLHCSCLENPRDGGAWWAAVYGVTQSRTRLKWLSSSSSSSRAVNFQMFKLDLAKAEEPEIKLQTSAGSSKKAREFQNIYFCFIDYAKAFVWITADCGKFFRWWEYQTSWPAFWEICMKVKKQLLELDMEDRLVLNRERSMSRLFIFTLLI